MYRLSGGQTATGVAVMGLPLRLELFQQAGQGPAPMADLALLCPGQFCGAAVELRRQEYRVITEAAVTPGLGQDLSRPAAMADDRRGVIGVAQVHQNTMELGTALCWGNVLQSIQKCRHVVGVGSGGAGVPR